MEKIVPFFGCFSTCIVLLTLSAAQTIQVDITPAHSTNHFRPNETLGAGIDRIPSEAIDSGLAQPNLGRALASGWQPVSYRNNTELSIEAWHWNPQGTWSEPGQKGYFAGSATPAEPIRYSYGYSLPHRGFTRNDGTPNAGFSRITDGDDNSYWKSNPHLTQRFTGESDSLHPQWVAPGEKQHDVFPARSDTDDGARHALVTAYAVKRPDGQWSLLVVNRDQQNAHRARIEFQNQSSRQSASFFGPVEISTFGKGQYQWHPGHTRYVGHAEYPAEPSVAARATPPHVLLLGFGRQKAPRGDRCRGHYPEAGGVSHTAVHQQPQWPVVPAH